MGDGDDERIRRNLRLPRVIECNESLDFIANRFALVHPRRGTKIMVFTDDAKLGMEE